MKLKLMSFCLGLALVHWITLGAGGQAVAGVSEGYWVWAGGKCYGGQGNGPVMVLVREVLRPNQGPLLAGWPVRDASLHPIFQHALES